MLEPVWRLLQHPPALGPWNMAVDEAIVRAVGDGQAPVTLRFYQWSAPTVSLGYSQSAPGGVDEVACRREGVVMVRRITGGRAVLHHRELTYSVSLALQDEWGSLSVSEAFARIALGLLRGLLRLGVQARLGASESLPGAGGESAPCFLARRMPAILVDERKLVGSAQRRWSRSLLQHGCLLLDFDPGLHRAVFPTWPCVDPWEGVTSLRRLLGRVPPIDEIVFAFAAGWREVFGGRWLLGELGSEEMRGAAELVRTRYGTSAWTFRRARRTGRPATQPVAESEEPGSVGLAVLPEGDAGQPAKPA